jgi:heme exporter protein CcmD
MGDYGIYIWSSYAVMGILVSGLILRSLSRYIRARRAVDALSINSSDDAGS